MFTLEYTIIGLTSSDLTYALCAPVDMRIESAYIISQLAISASASPKLVCEVYADDDATVIFSADSEASGFGLRTPVALAAGVGSKRYEAGEKVEIKADVTGTHSATDVTFVLKCVPARDI